MICLFQDSLGPTLVKFLYELGPNQALSFASEESPDMSELLSKLVPMPKCFSSSLTLRRIKLDCLLLERFAEKAWNLVQE